MTGPENCDYVLIREATIMVCLPRGVRDLDRCVEAAFYDVRTGVPLKNIYPELQPIEILRGHQLAPEDAHAILKWNYEVSNPDSGRVVNIFEMKQRRLDAVVADSILDQLKVISDLFRGFLGIAENATKEERFWIAQQVLGLIRKFSGRELSELQETVEWLMNRRKK